MRTVLPCLQNNSFKRSNGLKTTKLFKARLRANLLTFRGERWMVPKTPFKFISCIKLINSIIQNSPDLIDTFLHKRARNQLCITLFHLYKLVGSDACLKGLSLTFKLADIILF